VEVVKGYINISGTTARMLPNRQSMHMSLNQHLITLEAKVAVYGHDSEPIPDDKTLHSIYMYEAGERSMRENVHWPTYHK